MNSGGLIANDGVSGGGWSVRTSMISDTSNTFLLLEHNNPTGGARPMYTDLSRPTGSHRPLDVGRKNVRKYFTSHPTGMHGRRKQSFLYCDGHATAEDYKKPYFEENGARFSIASD